MAPPGFWEKTHRYFIQKMAPITLLLNNRVLERRIYIPKGVNPLKAIVYFMIANLVMAGQ